MEPNWPEEQLDIIRKYYPDHPTKYVANLIGRPPQSIMEKAKQLGVQKISRFKGTSKWNPEKEQMLTEMYAKHTSKEISEAIGISYISIKNRVIRLGLSKKMNSGCFPKGHIPANKGKKMTSDIKKRIAHTFFKKGNKPVNTLFDGAISIRMEKRTGIRYKWIRISDGKWDLLHRVNYKIKYGDIPTTTFLRCRDGNQLNCNPENWEPIDMTENMARNTIQNYTPDARRAMLLLGKLNKKLKNLQHGKEQVI